MSDPLPSSAGRKLPRHIAIIMDGNGRWAQERGLSRMEGHLEGANSARDITRAARQIGIEALTLYAFSSQNWARPSAEIRGLMDLLRDYLVDEREEILQNNIHLHAIGEIDLLPPRIQEPLAALRADSAKNNGMVLTLALSYGSRESLVSATKVLAQKAAKGQLDPSSISLSDMTGELPTCKLPPLDLIIRTSGEKRLSNFLLWEAAYAELYFCETLWPDFRRQSFYDAIEAFARRERRFGLTGKQVAAHDKQSASVEPACHKPTTADK